MRSAHGIGVAAVLLLVSTAGRADEGLKNPDFEEGNVAAVPAGWALTTPGGTVTVSAENPRRGKQCVRVVFGNQKVNAPGFLILLQQIDAAPYRGS